MLFRSLSSSENDNEDIDLDADEIQHHTVYYHLPEDAYANLFPLDPDLAASTLHTNRSQRVQAFKNDLLRRDGHCVVTEISTERDLEAAHLVASKKGSEVCSVHRLVCL